MSDSGKFWESISLTGCLGFLGFLGMYWDIKSCTWKILGLIFVLGLQGYYL